MVRLEARHFKPIRRMERHLLADLTLLPLRVNPLGVAHAAAGQVLQPGVAVEAATVLPDLGQPGPDFLDRGVDRDRPGQVNGWVRYKRITGQRLVSFLSGRAPVA